MAYDALIFPGERHRIELACCYQLLCYTGARSAELVHGEREAKGRLCRSGLRLAGGPVIGQDGRGG